MPGLSVCRGHLTDHIMPSLLLAEIAIACKCCLRPEDALSFPDHITLQTGDIPCFASGQNTMNDRTGAANNVHCFGCICQVDQVVFLSYTYADSREYHSVFGDASQAHFTKGKRRTRMPVLHVHDPCECDD